ncbi:hypothetical protein M5K25_012045 [Dendrobium thyrsiflorum]|uniref:DUF659 domain-containing protein n=1 Tax=Dendrobium thyrsiflorum TaxID=117978 RepID=A0ABD0V383_DENTH
MFYLARLPFNLARNPHYKNPFTFACNNNLAGYVPPRYNVIRTKLQRERDNIEKLLEPTKGIWKEKDVTLVCDGWTDPQRRPLINFMAVTESYPIFIKAVNCEGQYKDKFFISNLIKKVIMMVGPSNIIQVITDNAPVYRATGLLWCGLVHRLAIIGKRLNLKAPLNIALSIKSLATFTLTSFQAHWDLRTSYVQDHEVHPNGHNTPSHSMIISPSSVELAPNNPSISASTSLTINVNSDPLAEVPISHIG